MSNPFRQLIVDEILKRFRTITKGNGYKSDLGKQIFEWRDADFTLQELQAGPAGNLMDTDERHKNLTGNWQEHELDFEIYVVLAGEDQTPKTARFVMADITQAIGVDVKWNENAIDTLPGEVQLDVVQDKKRIGAFKRKFTVKYRTFRFNAYQKP